MAHKVTIDVEARFSDNLSGGAQSASKVIDDLEDNARQAAKEVDKLGKKRAEPKIDSKTDRIKRKLDDLDKKISKIGRMTATVSLKALDKATSVIKKVLTFGGRLNGKTFAAMAKVKDSNAIKTLEKITSAGKSIAGKTWTAAVKVKNMAMAPLNAVKNMLFSIKTLIAGIATAWAAIKFVKEPIALADAYSSAKIGFQTLLGESQGNQMMNKLDEFAKATPFKSSQVIAQTQRMLAMGWEAENIIDDMNTIGDAAASTGKGEQGLQQIVTALAQIKTKGRLSTEELNQLAEAGISAKRYIAEGLGYGSGDSGIAAMTKDLEDGAIASDAALQALLSGMEEFDGMMDRTANETVEGLWSQIQDTFEINIFRRWGQGLQDGAKGAFGTLVTLLNKADGALTSFGDTLYEIGKKVSGWVADKLEKTVERITNITDSFEFKNASLGEKIKMLWKGAISDPLKEWWDGGGKEKTAATAGKIGKWIGTMMKKGILALLGITDLLKEGGVDESGGMSVAQSFAKGFVDGFDVDAITDKLVDAISNVWNALPWWAKTLLIGYGGSKLAIGGSHLISAIGSIGTGLQKMIGTFNIASSAFPILTSSGSGLAGLAGKLGVKLGASTTGTALAMGSAGLAGGVTAGATLISGGADLYDAFTTDDETEKKANYASGGTKLGGVAVGAAIGTAIAPGVGTLIGAGIGGLVGWIAGDSWAESIREDAEEAERAAAAAKYESQGMKDAIMEGEKSAEELAEEFAKAKFENAKKHFGDIALSAAEISRLVEQIVWADGITNYEKFTSATKQAAASLETMKGAAEQTDRWLWKAGFGVTFNEDERESIIESFNEYVSSAQSFIENKHYEFTASAEMLLDLETAEGKSIVEGGNTYYENVKKQLDDLGGQLSDAMSKALEDGVISSDDVLTIKINGIDVELPEDKAIAALQEKIAEITNKIAQAESDAELELVKVKFGAGNLDYDSFDSFMATMKTALEERMAANDNAFELQVANLRLQYPDGGEEYEAKLATLIEGYTAKVDSVKADILGVELNIIGEAYKDELGLNAAEDLNNVLQYCIEKGIDPVELSSDKLFEIVGTELSGETASNILDMLSVVAEHLELVEVDGEILYKVSGVTTEDDVVGLVTQDLPETVTATLPVGIYGEKWIQNTIDVLVEDFGVPREKASVVTLLLSADKEVLETLDTSALATELGIPESQAELLVVKLTGEKSIENRIDVLASDFGIKDEIWKTITVNLKAKKGQIVNSLFVGPLKTTSDGDGEGFRGGIFGGSSAMASFARGGIPGFTDGGMVRGGSQLIEVAEEGSPEMIIPLSSQRRGRGLKLWAQAGNIMGVPGFARGGIIGGSNTDEGFRFHSYSGNDAPSGQTVQIEVGGITVEIQVNVSEGGNIVDAIKAQANEIAETVAGIMADAIGCQFENTPLRGGVA